jgi:Protein of unknown function (DUF3738)
MRGSGKNMRQRTGKIILSLAVITTPAIPLGSQTPPTQKPSFEVVSVKLNRSGQDGGSIRPSGDRLIATNVTLKNLLNFAFSPSKGQFLNQQIIGGPAWIDTDRFDVEAKLEGGGPSLPPEQLRDMLQALLEDRFQLKARRDSRELPIYNLVVTKGGGPKLSQDQTPPDPRQRFIRFISAGGTPAVGPVASRRSEGCPRPIQFDSIRDCHTNIIAGESVAGTIRSHHY